MNDPTHVSGMFIAAYMVVDRLNAAWGLALWARV